MTQVRVKAALMDLIPPYLQRRRDDLLQFRKFVEAGDFHSIQRLGHKLSGNAATFGFEKLSQIGAELENAADLLDVKRIERLLGSFGEFLEKLEVLPTPNSSP